MALQPASSNAHPSLHTLSSAEGTTTDGRPFAYPPLHSFPPFYTLQPNVATRAAQLAAWETLLVGYCSHHRLFRLSSSHAVFRNDALDRRLAPADAKVLFAHMRERGRAEFVDAAPKGKGAGWMPGRAGALEDSNSAREEIYVYWRTLEEWASAMVDWVEETSQRGAVLTVYEMTEGEQSRGKSWAGMPLEVVRRVLAIVVKRGRAVTFGEEEGLGVKFS